jgi:hypothetical protein
MAYQPASTGFLGYLNHMNAAAGISASSALAKLPVGNLLNDQLSKVWRSSTTNPWLVVDLGEPDNIDVVALIACNLGLGSTWRVRLSNSDPTGAAGEQYDSGQISTDVDVFYGLAIHLLPVTTLGRYLRLDLTDDSLPYVQAGRIVVQRVWRFAYGPRTDLEEEWLDASTRDQTEDGRQWVYGRPALRRVSGSLPAISETEYLSRGRVISRNLASRVSTLLCTESHVPGGLGTKTVWGLLERGLPFRMLTRTGNQTWYAASFSLVEQA